MKIKLLPEKTMGELQNEFSTAFPGLKLVFFSKPHKEFKGSAAKFMLMEKETPLRDISPKIVACDMNFEASMTVSQVEKMFEDSFALHVQVFRRSGRTWLETSVTDNLTLAEQMTKVTESENVHQEFVDPLDYREMD